MHMEQQLQGQRRALEAITGGLDVDAWQAKMHAESREHLARIAAAVEAWGAAHRPQPVRRSWVRRVGDILRDHLFLRVVLELVAGLVALGLLANSCQAAIAMPGEAWRFKHEYTRIVRSEWGLDAPIAALAAQIHQESGWNCRAVSPVGARGCAQFMPTTAAWIGDVRHELRGGDVFSPAWAFRAQATYMQWLSARIKASDGCQRMAFALAAYNGGLGYVYRRQKISPRPGVCLDATCEINPGIAAASQRENAEYPRRILRALEPLYVAAQWGGGACS